MSSPAQRAAQQRYRLAHREQLCERQRRRYAANPEQAREYRRRWAAEHHEQTRESSRRYRVAHRKQMRERTNRWAAANPERKRESEHHWRAAHSERYRENSRRWAAEHREMVAYYVASRRALKSGNGGSHTLAEWREKCALLGNVCLYCGKARPLTIDHKTPLIRGGTDNIDNCVPACASCNSRKGRKTAQEFLGLAVALR